jgi:lipopolysaccharide export system protein LptA
MKFKREYLLVLIILYIIFLLFQLKPKKTDWQKKSLPLAREEVKEVTRFTKEFSFTETKNEKTLFEIYAKEVVAQKDTKISLKDVILTFHLKEGSIKINCLEAKFDIEKKDAEISGRAIIKFPNGMNLWTENVYYNHSKGILECPILINISYNNFFGKCNSVNINVYSEIFSLKDLEIQSAETYFYFPTAEGNIKKKNLISKELVYIFYNDNIITLKGLNLVFDENKTIIKGNCFSGSLRNLKNYYFFAEEFESEFSSDGFIPINFKFEKKVDAFGFEENVKISAKRSIVYFDNGTISIINFEGSVEIERANDSIYCDVINGYFKEKEIDNVFFGDSIILCYNGWYITCDRMNYLQQNKTLLLNENVESIKGYLKIKSKWMKIFNNGEKIVFGGNVEMEEANKGMRIKGNECTYEEKEKKAVFLNNVIAWTKDYTLKTKRLEIYENSLFAKGEAELKGIEKEENFYLKAEEIRANQKEEKLEALGSVLFKYQNYLMEGYFLQIFQKEERIERFILSDLVRFSTIDSKQKGKGEFLDIYPEKNFLVLEGCPAILEDEKEGKIEANKLFILKEPMEIFIIDNKQAKITYKK